METSHAVVVIALFVGIAANFCIFVGIHWKLKKQREFTERNMAEQREALARYTEMHEESKQIRVNDNKEGRESLDRWNEAMDRYERLHQRHLDQ